MSMPLDLSLLSALEVLLEERSVTKAARRLNVSQSAVSHTLRKLRDQLSDPLLVASGRNLVPTARAEALQPAISLALRQLREAVRAPTPFDPKHSQRTFVIIGSDFGEFTVLPGLIARLRKLAPGVRLHMRPALSNVAASLAEGSADLAIGPALGVQAGLSQRALPDDPFVLVARSGHPALGARPTLKQYLSCDHLQVAPRGARGSVVDELLAQRGLSRNIALTLGHFTAAPFIVAQSELVWSAQLSLAVQASRYVKLSLFPHPLKLPPFRGAFTWHERMQLDPGHRWLRDILLKESTARGRP